MSNPTTIHRSHRRARSHARPAQPELTSESSGCRNATGTLRAFFLILAFSLSAAAAPFTISKAEWRSREKKLFVEGTGASGATVAVKNAATGAFLKSAKVEDNGRWKVRVEKPPAVPCRVRAESKGLSLERDVLYAPNCGGGATLSGVTVSGPSSVPENGSAAYTATAAFSDGSTQTVTAAAVWSENSSYASIAAGVLTTGEVPSDQAVTVTAAYTFNGATLSGSLPVTITNGTLTGSHAGRFTEFTGTATCLTCHADEAVQMHQSVHYQWLGDASEADGLNSATAGKLGGINDFCIYPDINWIGKLTNADGLQVDGGCAKCHAGLGAKPEPSPTQTQLENIDCLLCHSKNYKRTVDMVDGAYRFVPDANSMTVSLLQAAVDITLPDKNTCLNCHTKAGGGDNFKRGDIEEAHRNATAGFDIHMAPSAAGGAGLQCLDCHTHVGHRIAGRGIDMRERDLPNAVVCQNCHSDTPHDSNDLNRHTTRVNCNTCHVPEFAKAAATDMVRDWSLPGDLHPTTKLYEPHMTLASHVQPEYVWFNGRSTFYQFGDPAVPGANGRVLMAGPQGSVQDPDAKINAVKHHLGKQPVDPVTKRLFPLKIGIFFSTGDVDTAVAQGAAGVGWPYTGHEFADTERYMGLYHEVAPADQALQCASCHDNGDQRMNFGALGYTPKTTRNGKPLCSSCHGAKTASFYTLHNKHVRDKNINCVECHDFSRVAN